MLLAVEEGRGGHSLLKIDCERSDGNTLFFLFHKFLAGTSHANPSVIKCCRTEIILKYEIAIGKETIFAGLVHNSCRHLLFGFQRYETVFKNGIFPTPVNWKDKGFTACIDPVLFVGTNSQKNTIIFAIGSLHQIGM